MKKSGAASAAASTQPSDAEEGGALFSEGEEEKLLKNVPAPWFLFVFLLMVDLAWGDKEVCYS